MTGAQRFHGVVRHCFGPVMLGALVLAQAVASSGQPSTSAAQTTPFPTPAPMVRPTVVIVPPPDPGAVSLHEFVERLLGSQPGGAVLRLAPDRVRLVDGGLPPDLPVVLPLPPAARVLASAARYREEQLAELDVRVTVAAPLDEVRSALERDLGQLRWQSAPPAIGGGRFPPAPGTATLDRCGPDDQPARRLFINMATRPDGDTSARLHLDLDLPEGMLCARSTWLTHNALPPTHGVFATPAPLLRAPDDRGGPGNHRRAPDYRWGIVEAALETPLQPGQVEAYFAAQLEAHGWRRIAGESGDVLRWSRWQLPDGPSWEGLLAVQPSAVPGRQRLVLQVESSAPPPEPAALSPLVRTLVGPVYAPGIPASALPVYPTPTIGPAGPPPLPTATPR